MPPRRLRFPLLALLLAPSLYGCSLVAARVDAGLNTVVGHEPFTVSAEARALHDSLTIVDLHADSLLWRRNLLKSNARGHVDVPRLIEGNVALQVFTIVSKSPKGQNYEKNSGDTDNITLLTWLNGWPWRTHGSLKQRALFQSEKLHRLAADSNGRLRVIRTREDLDRYLADRAANPDITAGILGLEGLQVLEGDRANLAAMDAAGFRVAGLTHFFDNEIGGSAHGVEQGGLTEIGQEVVRELEARRIIIDLAHTSTHVIDDVLEMATRPVIVSHTGVRGTHDSPRNLGDAHLKAIAARGGLIGIGYWDGAVGEPKIENVVLAMKYVREVIGVQHLALGSDYDGTTEVPFDTSELAALTQALLDAGFSRDETAAIMGGNAVRFFRQNLPAENHQPAGG